MLLGKDSSGTSGQFSDVMQESLHENSSVSGPIQTDGSKEKCNTSAILKFLQNVMM